MNKLQEDGKGYSTLTSIRGVVKPAFQIAYNEEIVRRNLFNFKLTDVVINDSRKRISMTEKQQKVWLDFIRSDKVYSRYYDEFVVLPHITPHVFRHTFCTNMANAGMDIRSLQYAMGHSDAGITLNVYTHASHDRAAEQMSKPIDFPDKAELQKRKMSG